MIPSVMDRNSMAHYLRPNITAILCAVRFFCYRQKKIKQWVDTRFIVCCLLHRNKTWVLTDFNLSRHDSIILIVVVGYRNANFTSFAEWGSDWSFERKTYTWSSRKGSYS